MTLPQALEDTAGVGAVLSPVEAAKIVQQNGYKSGSKTFNIQVATTLAKHAKFKRVGRGQYERAGQGLVRNASTWRLCHPRESRPLIRDKCLVKGPRDHHVLSEETAAETDTAGWVWVVDPLDGTRNFVSGIPFFCVNIALCYDGEPAVAVTYDPNREGSVKLQLCQSLLF